MYGLPRTEAIAALDVVSPNGGLMTADEDLARFSRDWSGDHHGRPPAVARPRSVQETAAVMRLCSDAVFPSSPKAALRVSLERRWRRLAEESSLSASNGLTRCAWSTRSILR